MTSPWRFIVSTHATLMVEVPSQMNRDELKQTGSNAVVGPLTKPGSISSCSLVKQSPNAHALYLGRKGCGTSLDLLNKRRRTGFVAFVGFFRSVYKK